MLLNISLSLTENLYGEVMNIKRSDASPHITQKPFV